MHEARRTQIQIRLPEELDQWLTTEARRRMVSKTRLVEYAIDELRNYIARAESQGRIVAVADLYDEARA